jgi:hypothetical protein
MFPPPAGYPDNDRRAYMPQTLPTIRTLDELAEIVEQHPDVCVRYSRGPADDADGPSVDYESGIELPGLSADPLRPEPWWTRDPRDWYARQLCHYAHLGDEPDRQGWLITGRIVGNGPDREPLLQPWRPVAWISDEVLDEARARYEEHFNAGDSSQNGDERVDEMSENSFPASDPPSY